MKKILFYILVLIVFFFNFFYVDASWPLFSKKQEKSVVSKKEISSFLDLKKNSSKKNVCITWNNIIIRNDLSKKSSEVLHSLLSLIKIGQKIGYDVKSMKSLYNQFVSFSVGIKNVCSFEDFQNYRQKIKIALDDFRKELQLFKNYVNNSYRSNK